MGSSIQIYIGAYIKVKQKIEKITVPYNYCDIITCKKYAECIPETTNFCSICGSKLETDFKSGTYAKGWYNIVDDYPDLVDSFTDISSWMYSDVTKNYMILIPNSKEYIPSNWRMDTSGDTEQLLDLNPEFVTKDIIDLEELSKDIIDILIKEFGEENLSIHWGILKYYS